MKKSNLSNKKIISNKGVTLISVIIYVLVMTIVVGIIATITSFFYANVVTLEEGINGETEFSKFNIFFLEDTKVSGNTVTDIDQNGSYIVFKNGNKYSFLGDGIYLNKVKLSKNISSCEFEVIRNYDKTSVKVLITVEDNNNQYIKEYMLTH